MKFSLQALATLFTILGLAGCGDAAFWGDENSNGGLGGTGSGGGSGGGGSGGGGSGGGSSTCNGACSEAVVVHALAAGEEYRAYETNDDGSVVAYYSEDDPLGTNPSRTFQIFTKTVGQSMPVQLTPDTGSPTAPGAAFDVNRAGTRVAFSTTQDLTGNNPNEFPNIFIAAPDGSNLSQVTTTVSLDATGNPRFADDGTTLVFGSSGDLTGGNPFTFPQVFSINVDGSNLTQLTPPMSLVEAIDLSADGTRIVYQDQSDPLGSNADGSREIFAMNIDGSNLIQLTDGLGNSEGPRISNDGSRVVFASTSEFTAGSNPDGESEVYVINSDGSGLTRITDSDQPSGRYFSTALGSVDISGDGQWVVFNSRADFLGINTDRTFTIYWANSDGTQLQQLLREETKPVGVSNRFAERPIISGDGSTILFEALAVYATGAPPGGSKLYTHIRE